jgi:hypothetical protein
VSNARLGSEPKSIPFVPIAGEGQVDAGPVFPPSEDEGPRIGSWKISFQPPATELPFRVFNLMNVSLCGPYGSRRQRLFRLPSAEFVNPAAASAPCCTTV